MKKYITFLSTILCCSSLLAKTITVSNNPNSPGQFTRLDSAILLASAGDILLVSGSVTDYAAIAGGTITINKPITLYGAGYDPRNDQALATVVSTIHITTAGSGTTISGLYISNEIYEDGGTNNITISRCKISSMWNNGSYTNGINGNNYNINENIIGVIAISVYNTTTPISDIIIQNNLITGSIGGPSTGSNIIISNNYFSGSNPLTATGYAGALYNANIYNNIFYYKSTTSTTAAGATTNCVFSNNIYFNNTNSNPFNIGINNNSGSNNINANPDFVNIDLTTTSITRLDNFNLKLGSPGIGTGTDGKNIGPEGGSIPIQYPYTGYSAIPVIDSMSISNPVIPPNGTLKVKFTAHANN